MSTKDILESRIEKNGFIFIAEISNNHNKSLQNLFDLMTNIYYRKRLSKETFSNKSNAEYRDAL